MRIVVKTEQLIKEGIIEPCASEYASGIVVVKKKDGSPRVCIDYRRLNKVVDKYPLPLIEELLDKLRDVRVFSTIDLKNGYFHVAVETESKKYTYVCYTLRIISIFEDAVWSM